MKRKFNYRKVVLLFADIFIIIVSGLLLNYVLSLVGWIAPETSRTLLLFMSVNILTCELALVVCGAYTRLWRYFNIKDYIICGLAVAGGFAMSYGLLMLLGMRPRKILWGLFFIVAVLGILLFRYLFKRTFIDLTGVGYRENAKRTLIDSEAGVAAFKQYTSLYNDYGLPVVFDFVSRFRSGLMPLGVSTYATYNTLMVSAPEIRGLWDFTLFPGTKKDDGTIDRTVHTDGLCCVMTTCDNEQTRQNAWKFMKWWVSTDAQVRFGREMESILGASARYQTANQEAIRQLAWSDKQLSVLLEQMTHTKGFPEIAGGYSTTRHITNAIRKVINTKEDPRETLMNYARTINEEIRIKRREFDLPLD